MKKRLLSILLCLSMVFGIAVPTMTPQADAVIGAVIGTGLKMCTSIVNGCIKACKNDADKGAGKGVLAMFKYAAADFTGIDFGGSSGGSTQETIIQKVDLSQVEAELKNINSQLEKNNAAIYQLQSTVSNGLRSLSQQMEGLSQQIKDTKLELKYSTYLDTFFDFFNEYYEGISYYDKLMTNMLANGASDEYQKNLFDQFYQLQDVEYSGSLHSAVDKLGRYLQGKYIYSSPGSVIDVLSQYYILAYKDGGMSEEDARAKAAESTQDMISYLYYAYVMGVYYEQAIALYQTGVIDTNGGVYTTDFGTKLTQGQIDTTIAALWSSVELTAGCILADMRSNYHSDAPISLVYQTGEGTLLNRAVDYNGFGAERGGSFWLADPAEELKNYFDDEFCDAFAGIAKLSVEKGSTLTIYDDYYVHIKAKDEMGGSSSGGEGSTVIIPVTPSGPYTEKLHVSFGGQTVHTYTITVYEETGGDTFAAGLGTADYPYVVKTEVQFNSIKQHSDEHFVLKANLDYSNLAAGTIKKFTGSFDGNGYTISNCTIDTTLYSGGTGTAGCVGLFGEVTGTVRNLRVENIRINAQNNFKGTSEIPTKLYAGAIAGYVNGGSLLYCTVLNSSVSAAHNGDYGVCHAGGVVGSAANATLTNLVCRDTSVSASAKYESTVSDYDGQFAHPSDPGWAVAGGLMGASDLSDLVRCGYTQSEGYTGKIKATGGTGACAGGLMGTFISGTVFYNYAPKLCWATMATAPEATSNYTSVNKDCIRFGSVAGYGSTPMRVLYKYWSSYPEDLRSKFNSVRWWLDYEAVNVDTINKQAFIDFMNDPDTNNTDYKQYLAFDGFEELSDGSGLNPLFQFSSGSRLDVDQSLFDLPVRRTYVEGDYIDLTGLYSYQCVGLEKQSNITYPYVRISQGAGLLNAPLTAGTHTIELTASNGSPVRFTIEVLPASHIYLESFVKAPTCTEGGESVQTCLHCGAQKERKELEALGHDSVLVDPGYPATCTSNGRSPSYRCSRCGLESGWGLILGFHIYSEHVDGYPATCTKDGMTEGYICARCGAVGSGCEPIPATGEHRAVKVEGYAATCVATGLTDGEICGDCETVLKEQTVIPVTGHHDVETTILAATCVAGGVKEFRCSGCGNVSKLENIAPLGHDYKAAVTAPTCEAPGYTTHTCTRCASSYTDGYIAPTGHKFGSGTVTKEPTCTSEGEKTYTCSCGQTHTEPIARIPHSYTPQVTKPTCTAMGFTTYACTCGDSYKDDYTLPTGHTWNDGETVTAPTLTHTGLLLQTCSACGAERETIIPALSSCDGGEGCPSHAFLDAPDRNHWAHLGIDFVLKSGLFYGTSDQTFSPDLAMTRAMLVSVLYRLAGSPGVKDVKNNFTDVPADAYYASAVIWANQKGIVYGTSETKFTPDGNITREQLAAILYRYAQNAQYDTDKVADLTAFPDVDDISAYARRALAWANAEGLVSGTLASDGETYLDPQGYATRAQVASILMRFVKNIVEK